MKESIIEYPENYSKQRYVYEYTCMSTHTCTYLILIVCVYFLQPTMVNLQSMINGRAKEITKLENKINKVEDEVLQWTSFVQCNGDYYCIIGIP